MSCKHSPKMKSIGKKCVRMQIFHKNKDSRSKDQKKKKRNLFCSQWKLVQTELTSWRNEISFRVSCTYPLKAFWGWKVQTQKITIAMIFFLTYKRITMRSVYILHQLIPTSIRHQKLRLTCRESSLVDFLHHVKLRENY